MEIQKREKQRKQRWQDNFIRIRVLYQLKHISTNTYTMQHGWRFDPIPHRRNELLDATTPPLMLADQTLSIDEYEIVSAVDLDY